MIEKTIILSLDQRIEISQKLYNQCINKGWDVERFIVGEGNKDLQYDWIDKDFFPDKSWKWGGGEQAIHHFRAHLAHKKIIIKAMKNKYNNFLLLEDDAILLPRFETVFNQLVGQIINKEWDLIYLGYHAWEYEKDIPTGMNIVVENLYNKNHKCHLLKPHKAIAGFHGILINNSAYYKLLTTPIEYPLDHMMNMSSSKLKRFMCVPIIIDVIDTFSY